MKNFLFTILLVYSILSSYSCYQDKDKNLDREALVAYAISRPQVYQVSANLTDGTKAYSNALVYFSPSTSTTTNTKNATTTTNSNTDNSPVFTTSTTTDSNGNLDFKLQVGDFDAFITTLENKSMAFKIKIEHDPSLSTDKKGKATITYADGTVKVAIIKVSGQFNSSPDQAITFVCGFNPKGDTAPPELISVETDSKTVDVSSGTGTITIKAKLEEGKEGSSSAKKPSGIKSVVARVFSPKRVAGGGFSTHANLKLNPASGLYEGNATLSNFVENGTWKVGLVSGRDNSGNEREYILDSSKSTTAYTFNGCGQKINSKISIPEFEVKGSNPDTAAPTITVGGIVLRSDINGGATQNPIVSNIDVSTSTATPKEVDITVTLTATDTGGTGNISGVSYIDARLQSYSWWQSSSNYLGNTLYMRLDRISGDSTSGTYQGKATIRSFAEGNTVSDGLWKVGGIWVTDRAGNSQWYSRDTINKSFTIINASTTAQADFYSPELKSITIDKTSVAFDESFILTADVEDKASETTTADQNSTGSTSTTTTTTTTTSSNNQTPSGVRRVSIQLLSPLKQLDSTLGTTKNLTLTLNSSTNKYEGTLSFPSANNEEGGIWKIGVVEVSDRAGNIRVYKLTEGYNFYTYIKITRTDGDISNSFTVTNILPGSIERK